jgi:hypothetical protein
VPGTIVNVVVLIEHSEYKSVVEHKISSLASVEQLIQELLVRLKAPGSILAWEIVYQNRILTYKATIGSVTHDQAVKKLIVVLRQATTDSGADTKTTMLEGSEFELALDDANRAAEAFDEEVEAAESAEDDELADFDEKPAKSKTKMGKKMSVHDEDEDAEAAEDEDVSAKRKGKKGKKEAEKAEPAVSGVVFDDMPEGSDAKTVDLDQTMAFQPPSSAAKKADDDDLLVTEEELVGPAEVSAVTAKGGVGAQRRIPKRKTVTRQATVRYYNRMNPERVYPLLVMITKEMVEKAIKLDTDQKSTGPIKFNLEAPVEIEPIIPGCACYPPKIVARLDQKDFIATFHVVPQIVGTIEGARVVLRQGIAPVAEIGLDAKVVRQIWVVLSGSLTFAMPVLSGLAKHYQIDLQAHAEDGFSSLLKAMQLALDYSSPLWLAVGFGVLTLLVYFLTRARTKDVFWEIKTIGPDEKLQAIAKKAKSHPDQAANELLDLLAAYPDHQPARIFYSEWHYKSKAYGHALQGYQDAFELGTARAVDYLRASLAATHLGRVRTALKILQEAETLLPERSVPGSLLFNMGCYHTRLGNHAKAIQYLQRAIVAGYRKKTSYLEDRDLDPLRSYAAFRALINQVQRIGT